MTGYRALIVDNDVYASRLSQFLMRSELNNKVIQTYSISDSLGDAYFTAEQSEFIYIDPFANGLPESIRFIAELLSRSPVKAITLFRSGAQWQEHWREMDTLALPPMQLRKMLSLDKDRISDAAFPNQIRNNILSMERELQEQIQRHGYHVTEIQAGRSGISDMGPMSNFNASGATVGFNQMNPMQLTELANNVAYLLRQQQNPTHPLLSGPAGFDVATLQQLRQEATATQARVKTIEDTQKALQDAVTKQQDQIVANQRGLRDFNQTADGVNGRITAIESWQPRSDAANKKVTDQVRFLQLIVSVMGVVLAILLITVLFLLLTGHR